MSSAVVPIVPESAALLTVRQVAALLGCSARHVYRLADRGAMPRPTKLGDVLVRWNRSDLQKWLDDGCPRSHVAGKRGAR